MDLDDWRSRINDLDDQILSLLNQRGHAALQIGELKRQQDSPYFVPEREAQLLDRLLSLNRGPLGPDAVRAVWREILSASLALENPLPVGYLGPAGTFTHAAAMRRFGTSAKLIPLKTIADIFEEVERSRADYGVVPVENSTDGAVGRSLDLLLATPVHICGEVLLAVHQCLMSTAAAGAQIRKVFAHAQSLGQCHEWLNQNLPAAERVAVVSNAEGARLAAAEPGSASIGSRAAAELYQLDVVAANIEDQPNNTTRFVVIGGQVPAPSGRDKTSLAMSTLNRPGAMHDLLAPLAQHGVDMTRMESRPSRTGLWEYVFFVDLRGHQQEPHVARALTEVRSRASFLKILGSYPAAL
jgi:chorismate mutase / prephenate dehydratase